MIDAIDDCGKLWGIAKRRILLGGYGYGNGGFHVDGFDAKNVIGKLLEGRGDASQVAPPEVYRGEALAFQIGLSKAPEKWFWLAHYYYVVPRQFMGTKAKIKDLKEMFPKPFKDERAYYSQLHEMHCFLLGRMPEVPRGELSNSVSTVTA